MAIFCWLFVLFYGLLEGILWMLWAYWLLLINRLSGLWHATTSGEKELLKNSLFVQAGLWIFFAVITASVPMPELGVTRAVARAH